MRKNKCKDCPFSIENIFKYKASIYEKIKEVNKNRLHTCHTISDMCVGFIERAKELNDIDVLKNV